MKCPNCKEEISKAIQETGRFLRCANCDFPVVIPRIDWDKVEYIRKR